jgi:HprK-related kinase B
MSDLEQQLLASQPLVEEVVELDMGYCSCRLVSNSNELLALLASYFSEIVRPVDKPTYTLTLLESEPVDIAVDFTDWQREPGKTGRKDSYVDIEQGRLIRKVRTGMVFLQSQTSLIAIGPCLANDNQVINFICSQMMTWLQQRDWLICHAACVVRNNKALAIAGFSGGGKSSLMLNMLEQSDTKFLTNDRLFINAEAGKVNAAGVPKMPRINPGTIVHNPRLHDLIDAPQRQQLLALPKDELWQLEDKYDADIHRFYGEGRSQYQAPFHALLILNWSRDSQQETAIRQVDISQRLELLAAVMKSPGPFYQDQQGFFIDDNYQANPEKYIQALVDVIVFEATGKVDFDCLADLYLAAVQ